jgi:cyclophilin family peptidyl-prolyl cis-trans isomerase
MKGKAKAQARRRRARQPSNWPVYLLAGVLLVAVAWIGYSMFQGSRSGAGQQWSQPPAMALDPARHYSATIATAKGDIVVDLFADKTPVTVNNFVFLARQGYYDNTTFHRVIEGFMAQGGDPTATGTGGPGYTFQDEIVPDLTFDEAGLLAMANAGPNTNGSQFFITYAPATHLNGLHTIFGRVTNGLDVAESLTRTEPGPNAPPGDKILTVRITEQ